jgi:hypothetical protein
MRHSALWCLVVGLVTIAACSRQPTTPCQPDRRYATARSAPPVQIPDDLSPHNENDALRLPVPAGSTGPVQAGECLETPPSFFGESRPFQLDAEAEAQSRRERRAARREERRRDASEAPAADPASPPAESREPPRDEDRVIEN